MGSATAQAAKGAALGEVPTGFPEQFTECDPFMSPPERDPKKESESAAEKRIVAAIDEALAPPPENQGAGAAWEAHRLKCALSFARQNLALKSEVAKKTKGERGEKLTTECKELTWRIHAALQQLKACTGGGQAIPQALREEIDTLGVAAMQEFAGPITTRMRRKRDGDINRFANKVFDHHMRWGKEADRAVAGVKEISAECAQAGKFDIEAASRLVVLVRATTEAINEYDHRRANYIENRVANLSTGGLRLLLEGYYRHLEDENRVGANDETRWDEPFKADGSLNLAGVVKEYLLYEVPSAIYRFALMGGDYDPRERETFAALWMELAAAVVATGGTLALAMLMRRHPRVGKSKIGKFIARAISALIFGAAAGWISYWGIHADGRGSDLWYAAIRGGTNGVIRLALPDGMIALFDALRGVRTGEMVEEVGDELEEEMTAEEAASQTVAAEAPETAPQASEKPKVVEMSEKSEVREAARMAAEAARQQAGGKEEGKAVVVEKPAPTQAVDLPDEEAA